MVPIPTETKGGLPPAQTLLWTLHGQFIRALDSDKESLLYFMSEPYRMGGIYWGLTALDLLGKLDISPKTDGELHSVNNTEPSISAEPNPSTGMVECLKVDPNTDNAKNASEWETVSSKAQILNQINACKHKDGGYGPAALHDAHIVSTHYVVLILSVYDALDCVDIEAVSHWIASLQNADGSFKGDKWGETDTRFVYCGLSCLTILDRLDLINVAKAAEYLCNCKNYDGGFGWVPNGESHAASAFCCVAGLALTDRLNLLNKDELGYWLCERQTPGGGFNGRPEKAPDVCYSWWILASLCIIGRMHWMDQNALTNFILESQDDEEGGISDRPGNVSDVFHTFFGIAALSLMGSVKGLKAIHPVYAIPTHTVQRLQLPLIVYESNASQ